MLAAALAAWLITGTKLADVGLFLGHELLFVLLPGSVAYLAFRARRPGMLELAAIGYVLGSLLELGAFALTAALHIRGALWAYPPLVVIVGIAVLRRRPDLPVDRERIIGERWPWVLAALSTLAILYLAVAYFGFEPLPNRAPPR